jgi:DNA polymerase
MAKYFPGEKISRIHGQPRWIGGRMVVPMMHPAAALHQPQNRPLIETDFRRLPEFLAQAEQQADRSAASHAPEPEPKKPDEPDMEQLSLF